MRVWDRYFVVTGDKFLNSRQDVFNSYGDAQMQTGKRALYGTREEFFKGYSLYFPRRYEYYYEYLRNNVKKEEQGLSLGGGQCVNELRLINEGYRIQCSDIDETYSEEAKRLFPEFKFTKFNIMASPFPNKSDYVILLSTLFCFDHDQLLKVFKNIAASLKTGGIFITDPGGAEDNIVTSILDKYLSLYDAGLQYIIKKFLLGKDARMIKEPLGYRLSDADILTMAEKAGFVLEDLQRFDYVTELKDRLLLFNRLPDAVVSCFGLAVPYVRFFKFRKT